MTARKLNEHSFDNTNRRRKTVVWVHSYAQNGTKVTSSQLCNRHNVYSIRKVIVSVTNLDGNLDKYVHYEYSVSPKRTSWHGGFTTFVACKCSAGWRLAGI